MLKIAPEPMDVQDLQFKLRCRLKVFDNTDSSNFSKLCSLVTCASRFGLIFVGLQTSGAQAIQLKNVEEYGKADGDKVDYPRRNFPLPSPPSHLSVNCEHTILAVVIERSGCPCVVFYDVKSFLSQNISQIAEIRLSPTPGTQVTEVNWNPALSNIFTACKSDGSLGIYEIKNSGIDINELPAAAGATCFCWSPKGKQIAVGSRDGKITQYKPDLKAVKVINAPPLKEPSSIQSLQWVSNYQFIGVFQPVNPDNQASFIVIDAPKAGDPTYTNYDDICYGNGNTRPPQFYTVLLQTWNILMAASSNSMEVGILGNTGDCWTQWIMGDAARAELPLSANHQDTLPIGCALGIGCTQPIPWGESTLPPAPILLLLSHHGTLCCFNVVYVKEGMPSVCTPPDPVKDISGLSQFVSVATESKSKESQQPKEATKVGQPVILQVPNVENVKPATTISAPPNIPTTLFKVQPNVVTPTSLPLNLSQSSPVSLFGGQVTLTQQESKNSSQSSLISKYKPLYPPTPSAVLTKIVTSAPVVQSSASTTTVAASAIAKPVVTTASSKPPEPSVDLNKTDVTNVDIKAEEEAEAIFAQMVREESIYLESELKAVLHQGKHLKLNLGTDDTKTKIVENTKLLQDFFREVVENCTTQNAEIHILKQNVLQSWAWYEEVKSRHLASKDESMMMLMRAQPLDSASEKQLADIRHAHYYIESQVAQANLALDEQWENFQDYCKKIRNIEIPTMEMIFQTMVKQNAISRKQSYILKVIQNRIKSKSRSAVGASLLLTVDDGKDLSNEFKQLRMDPEDICQIQCERVMNRTKNFTPKKCKTLSSYLKKREIPHISAIKPQLSSSIIQASPSSKLKQFSLIPKTPSVVPKKLDFVQSTPNLTSSELQSSTPIEGLQHFTLKFEAKNFTNLPEKTFTPLTKSGISSSPNSAFVSTSFGSSASTSVSTSTSLLFKPTTPVVKTTPNYVVTSTAAETNQPIIMISANNVSKPFSFISSPAIPVSSQSNATVSKSAPNLFHNSTTKSPFSFNFQTVSTVTSAFGETEAKISTPAFNVASATSSASTASAFNFNSTTKLASTTADSSAKAPSTPGFGTVTSVKPSSNTTLAFGTAGPTKVPSAPNLIFGGGASVTTKPSLTSSTVFNTVTTTTTVAPFSFDSSATNIFGTTNQKNAETSVSTTPKSFMFSARTTSTSVTTTPVAPAVSSVSVSSSLSDATKLASISEPVVTNAVLITPKSPLGNAASSTSIFASPTSSTSFLVASLTGTSNQSSVFNNSVASTQSSVFPVGSTKASIFTTTSATITPSVTSVAAVPSPPVTTAATANVVGTRSPNSPSIASNASGNEAATSQQSIFVSAVNLSQSTTPTSGLLFPNTPSTKPSIFGSGDAGSPKTSVFGNPTPTTTTSGFGTATTTMQSLFSSIPSATTQPAIFGGATAATAQSSVFAAVPSTATQSSVFAAVPSITTSSSVFAAVPPTTTPSSVFAAVPPTTTPSSVFAAVPPTTTPSSVFAAVPPTTTPSSVFAAVSSTTTQSSIFSAVPSTSAPVFGAATAQSSVFAVVPSTTTQSSIFSSVPSPSTAVFGAATPATPSSLFGPATNQAPPFGGSLTSAAQQSIFGSTAPTTTSQSPQSIFGGTSPSTTSQPQSFGMFGDASQKSSIFGGGAVTSTQSSVFGGTNQSVFGSAASSAFGQNQSGNAFGQTCAFGSSGSSFGGTNGFGSSSTNFRQTSGSIFGSTPTTSSGSIFGTTSTTGSAFGSSNSVFGAPTSSASSPFSSGTVFASTASQPSTGSFGFGGLNVGATPTTTNSGFGTTPSANPFGGDNKSIFGSPPASSSTSVFGSNTDSLFGTPPSQTFGSGFGNQSPFGQQSTFGQSSFGSTTFGQQPSGPFSGGNSPGVGQTGFGAAPGFQKSSGFGTAPVFGGSPSFGNTTSFGGAPSFGSSPTFGSGAKVFGSSSPGFGATTNNPSAGFGNLATQPTVGFGNLAQQAVNAPAQGTAFSGNSSFSSWR